MPTQQTGATVTMIDAKPHRPVRSLRVRGDENVPPALINTKTIHQRNKSSPALTSQMAGHALKAAAKRTAFGDIANTVNGTRPSKDDTAITTKPVLQVIGKTTQAAQEKKSTAFLRPAQRPMSISNLKGLLSGVVNAGSIETGLKSTSTEVGLPSQPSNTRKILTKRNTTIFKDPSLDPVAEAELQSIGNNEAASEIVCLPQHLPKLIVEADLQSYPSGPTTAASRTTVVFPSESSQAGVGEGATNILVPSNEAEDLALLRSDGIYIDGNGNVRTFPEAKEPTQDAHDVIRPVPINPAEPSYASLHGPDIIEMPGPKASLQPHLSQPALSLCSQLPPPSDPEEYWDDGEEENIDEEAYVTARSYRSRGENTTGGATTVLFPHVSQKVKKELAAARQLVEATRTPEEIEDESFDTSMVAEYGDEIFEYMRHLEVKMLPNAHYMDNQHEIQWSMRAVLMDWLVQVHHRFNLLPETLFLCANYIDRFLSCKVVSLGKLQLVGATAIFIAAKYEEINCPSVQEIVYMVDGGYTIDEILKAERFMLTMLQFELGWPGPMSFLRRISKADDYDLETRTLAKYFLEVTIMDERFIGSPPSFAAAGAHCLARMMLHKGQWSPQHVYYSNYTYSQLLPLLNLMMECCEDPRKHHSAVYNKYCDKRYKRAASFVENEMSRGFRLQSMSRDVVAAPVLDLFDTSSWARC